MTVFAHLDDTRRYPLRWWLLAATAALGCACDKSPIDAILVAGATTTDIGTGTSTETGTGDPCVDGVEVSVGTEFRLRAADGQCLAVGERTTVVDSPAFETALADCAVAGEVWQAIPSESFQGAFELQSPQLAYDLDIEMGKVADGTPLILFAPTMVANQRFYFIARRPRVFSLVPAHARSSCVSSSPPSPAIFRCAFASPDQEWQAIPAFCK